MRLLLTSKSLTRPPILLATGTTPIAKVSEVDRNVVPEPVKARSPSPSADDQVVALVCAKRDTAAPTPTSDALFDEEEVDSFPPTGCGSMLEINERIVGKLRLSEVMRERTWEVRGSAATLWIGHTVSLSRHQEDSPYVFESVLSHSALIVVHLGQVNDEETEAYVASSESLRAAGSFVADGLGGPFTTGIGGDHYSVVDISLPLLCELASELGVS